MTDHNDGVEECWIPAPQSPREPNWIACMRLRDWFAGMAMEGMLADGVPVCDELARESWKAAHAMLVERERLKEADDD